MQYARGFGRGRPHISGAERNALMDDGVTIQLPETVLIDPDVTAGEDTIIEPGVQYWENQNRRAAAPFERAASWPMQSSATR